MDKIALKRLVEDALREDIAWGDITTEVCIDASQACKASLTSKSHSVVCGLEVFAMCFRLLDPGCTIEFACLEGSNVKPGDIVATILGKTSAILTAERTALNFFCHMSGIATATARAVSALEGTDCIVADTRKTLPLLRMIEKYAVMVGGGANHRFDLSSLVLIKDNHIKACGSITDAIRLASAATSHTMKIECEVTTPKEAMEAADAGADIIMLDNMSPDDISQLLAVMPEGIYYEASGGITIENCREYALAGVDVISMGSIIHSAPYANFSLEF
jgi:nicotinate-nucleotide pyrophosphorylase (carboxylating)